MTAAGVQPSALQWTLAYPATDLSSFRVVAGPSAATASKNLYCTSSVGQVTCLLAGMNTSTIPNGVVASVVLTTSVGARLNTPIQVLETSASSLTGDRLSSSGAQGTVTLSGVATGVSALACSSATLTGSGSTTCTVTLTQPAPAGGSLVTLADNSAVLTVPASVTVPAGSTSAAFPATAASVSASSTATITASLNGSSASAAVGLYPAALLTKLGCTAASITGTGSTVCTVSLSRSAPYGGSLVALSSTTSALAVPASLLVPSGSTTASFTATAAVASITVAATATVSAALNGSSASWTVGLLPSILLTNLTCAPTAITGSGSTLCTLTLNGTAPAGGAVVSLADNHAALTVPSSVTVPAGSSSATFTATASGISVAGTASITATLNGSSVAFLLSLQPAALLTGISCAPASLATGATGTCTVTLSAAAPAGGSPVTLASSSALVSLPPSLTVPAGSSSGTFAVKALSFSADSAATLSAALSGVTQTFSLKLVAALVPTSLTCVYPTLTSNTSTLCTVTLNRPAPGGGASVTLSGNSSLLSVPASVTVATSSSSVTFYAAASAVPADSTATLTATIGGAAASFALNLTPPPALTGFTCSPAVLTSAGLASCTVTLDKPALVNGSSVAVTTGSALLTVPGSVLVAAGKTAAAFSLKVLSVPSDAPANVNAALSGSSLTFQLNLQTPSVPSGLSCASASLSAKGSTLCTVTMNRPSLGSGTLVSLKDNSNELTVPASVNVAAGANSATFYASTSAVTAEATAAIQATANGGSAAFSISLVPPPALISFNCAPATLASGAAGTCTVALDKAAPASGSTVTLAKSSALLSVQSSVTVGAGKTSVTFPVKALSVTADTTATVDATLSGTPLSFQLTLQAPTIPSSVSCAPATLYTNGASTCTVTLNHAAPVGGSVVTLSDDNATLTLPASVTVPAGATSAAFVASAGVITVNSSATIAAALSGGSSSFTSTLASQLSAPALVRVNAGGAAYTDRQGITWAADTNPSGFAAQSSSVVTGTLDPDLYARQRYTQKVPLQYQFAAPSGSYNVKLKFAELSYTRAGQRVFNVSINGSTVTTGLDVFSAAGGALKALDRDFPVNSTGQIVIQLVPVIDNPMVSAIEITPTPVGAVTQSALPKSVRSAASTATASIAGAAAEPEVSDTGITAATEVGMRFRATRAGLITGMRFYKGSLDTGVHVGHLWSNGGTLLAGARFENETESGWQQVEFAPPVTAEAGQSYVVSYQAPYGHFAGGAPRWAASSAGTNLLLPMEEALYGYGPGFPAQVRANAAYLVDVVFEPAPGMPAQLTPVPASLALSCAPRVLRAGDEFECELTSEGPTAPEGWSAGVSATSGSVRLPAVVRAAANQRAVRFRGSVDAAASIPSVEIVAGPANATVRDSLAVLPGTSFVLNAPEVQNVRTGDSVRFYVSARSGTGALTQVSAAELPAGATFLPATGLFAWSPAPGQEGEYAIEFTAPNPDGSLASVRTRVVVDAGHPVITNARSLSCTPQGLATLEGRWLSQWREEFTDPTGASSVLGGTSVRVNGVPVPVLRAGPDRVEFQCPSLDAGSELSIVLETAAGASSAVQTTLRASDVQILPVREVPGQYGYITNQASGRLSVVRDFRGLGEPAQRGVVVAIHTTGLGGTPGAWNGLTVRFGDAVAEVVGILPGAPGVTVVQVSIPEGAPLGNAVPVQLELSAASVSRANVAIE